MIEAALSMEEPEIDADGIGILSDTEGNTDGDTDLILGSDSVNSDNMDPEDALMAGADEDDSDTFLGIV